MPKDATTFDLSRMSAAELLRLQRDTRLQLESAKSDPIRNVKQSGLNSPRDPLVKRFAADTLRDLRRQGLSYDEIGESYGVTRERVRQLGVSLGIDDGFGTE